MTQVIEVEKVKGKEYKRVLYSGDSAKDAAFVEFANLRPYHRVKRKAEGDNVTIQLIVDNGG